MYGIVPTTRYRRAYKRMSSQQGFKSQELEKVIDTIAKGKRLEEKYKDHSLTGTLREYRECHVQNDVLLVYRIEKRELILILVDLGTHSSLFGK